VVQGRICADPILSLSSVPAMRPFFVARVSDLRPGDFVFVACACGRIWLATKTLLTTAGLPPKFPHRDPAVASAVSELRRNRARYGIDQVG
jgi:hypothetical protein